MERDNEVERRTEVRRREKRGWWRVVAREKIGTGSERTVWRAVRWLRVARGQGGKEWRL